MSVNTKLAEAFNKCLLKLSNELVEMYPTVRDFKMFKGQIKTGLLASKFVIIKLFKTHLEPYGDHILSKNEEFFLEFDVSGTPLEAFNHLKEIVKTADDETKDQLWKYIITLYKLAARTSF